MTHRQRLTIGCNGWRYSSLRAAAEPEPGLLFAILYVGLEILTENPEATNSISVWHFPLIWFLAGILSYFVLYIVRTIRSGKVRERAIKFSISVVVAALLALFWLYPLLAGLVQCFGGSGC